MTYNQWLTRFIGKPTYRVECSPRMLLPDHLPQGRALVEARVPAEDGIGLVHLQQLGFQMIDCNLTLERSVLEMSKLTTQRSEIRFAQEKDELGVRLLARDAFEQNRFHRDPQIPNEVASRIKEEWAGNYFRGQRGDWMVVVEDDQGISGFLQLLKGPGEVIIVDLIAVASRRQREGLARAMIAFAFLRCLSRPAAMRVGTQLGNTASLALYQSLGFQIRSAVYLLHLHRQGTIVNRGLL